MLKAAAVAGQVDVVACHGGVDANPSLGAFGQCGVAIFVAEVARSLPTRAAERPQVDRWLEMARTIYGRHARAEGKLVKRGTKHRRVVLSSKERATINPNVILPIEGDARELSTPLYAANTALFAATDLEDVIGGAEVTTQIRNVITDVACALSADPDRSSRFVRDLDQVLLREELRSLLAARGDARAATVETCVWRAASAERARQGRAAGLKISHWLGVLADGALLLVWKLGARWEVMSGGRDEVLATVPDALLESASNAVLGGHAKSWGGASRLRTRPQA